MRWTRHRRSFRRSWPRYLMLVLFFVTGLSILVLVIDGLDGTSGADRDEVPAAVD